MSANETRVELFAAFRELAETATEMRAGQLMAAVGELCADLHGRGLWEASDAEVLEAVWQFRRDFQAATGASTPQEA
jgi:molybdopterin converting factor small subunit